MKEKVINAAKKYLDSEGVEYGEVARCEETDPPESFKVGRSWVVEFEGVETGARFDGDHVIVFVNPETLEVTIFPTM